MNHAIKYSWLLAVTVAVALPACTSAAPDARAKEPTAVTGETNEPATKSEATSDQVDSVRGLLLARHERDLPRRASLDQHPNAESALRQLATDDNMLIVRARALQLLGMYPTPGAEELLLRVAGDSAAHAKLRAAAVFGLGAYDLAGRSDLRSAVVASLEDGDARVGMAAVVALRNVASAHIDLERVANSRNTPLQVRDAAGAAVR